MVVKASAKRRLRAHSMSSEMSWERGAGRGSRIRVSSAATGRLLRRRLRAFAARRFGPRSYRLGHRLVLLARYYGRVVYEPDLLFVQRLSPRPLLVDIGADAGQSALCMAMLRAEARIVSFEANADNIADLALVRRILGERFSYHHVGLSDRDGTAVLSIPVVGRTPMLGESSLRTELDPSLEVRLGKVASVVTQQVSMRTFDSYGLRPDFVKIDVQGHELKVLHGMASTLRTCRPALLLERGERLGQILAYLRTLGYRPAELDPATGDLAFCDIPQGLNYFLLPGDTPPTGSTDQGAPAGQ
jgi:FkbM family methyltransferase